MKFALGSVVALTCVGAIATASRPTPNKIIEAEPKVNPATEYRSQTWLNANAEIQKLKVPESAYVLKGEQTHEKVVALTFDDAPRPETTEQIMAILQQEKAPATFFMIGKQVERFPNVTREILGNGFTMANHSYSHVNLKKIPYSEIVTEYAATNDAVKDITGVGMKFCRPPGGDCNIKVEKAAAAVGLKTVLWTDDPSDYAEPGKEFIMEFTLSHLTDGGIILLHDGVDETIADLPKLIQAIRAKGYKIVPLEDLPSSRV